MVLIEYTTFKVKHDRSNLSSNWHSIYLKVLFELRPPSSKVWTIKSKTLKLVNPKTPIQKTWSWMITCTSQLQQMMSIHKFLWLKISWSLQWNGGKPSGAPPKIPFYLTWSTTLHIIGVGKLKFCSNKQWSSNLNSSLKSSLSSFNQVSHCDNFPRSLATYCCRRPKSFCKQVVTPSSIMKNQQSSDTFVKNHYRNKNFEEWKKKREIIKENCFLPHLIVVVVVVTLLNSPIH